MKGEGWGAASDSRFLAPDSWLAEED